MCPLVFSKPQLTSVEADMVLMKSNRGVGDDDDKRSRTSRRAVEERCDNF